MMSLNEISSRENDLRRVLKLNGSVPIHFNNRLHSIRLLENLQSLRKNEDFCDIKLETDDHTIVYGHKNVLVAASPYFQAMFSSFKESNTNLINIKEFDSVALQLLVNFIYTGEIMVTNDNVQVLLPAANLLQLDYVSSVCAEFLQTQLDISNCLPIKAFAELHNCADLLSSSEVFVIRHFLEILKGDEFLSLSCKQLIDIISRNDLAVAYEDKVFECVIKWVKNDFKRRKDLLPELMEHVRLPLLVYTPIILKNVIEEPLLKNNPKCKDFITEALHFNVLQSFENYTIPQRIRCKPRQFGALRKVILLFNRSSLFPKCYIEWYDPKTNTRMCAPEMNNCYLLDHLGIVRDQFVYAIGGVKRSSSQSFCLLDVSSPSPCWVPMVDMLVGRSSLGVGVLNDCLYAVGGYNNSGPLNSVEVFGINVQKWKMATSMTTKRCDLGVGILNDSLYAVGGSDGSKDLKSVERYDPIHDTWTLVDELSVCRNGVGIGVLDGVMYAVGGSNGTKFLKSIEAYKPSNGFWYSIADMCFCRYKPGVVALGGLLYVIGGETEDSMKLVDTIEVYNPKTNTWSVKTLLRSDYNIIDLQVFSAVVIDRPHCLTYF